MFDIAVAASDDRHALLRNEVGVGRNWLEVELVGTRSNRDAVGARVILRTGSKQQAREVIAGDSYASQSSLRLHFGWNQSQSIEELVVRWPASGTVQRFRNIAANCIVQITEGDASLAIKHYPAGRVAARESTSVIPD